MKPLISFILILVLTILACSPAKPVGKDYLPNGVWSVAESHPVTDLWNTGMTSERTIQDACLWDC